MDRQMTMVGVVVGMLGAGLNAGAQTATQVVRFQVGAVNQIAVSGSPAPMIVSSAAPGSAPTPVVVVGTSYAITTNEPNKKITASIDQAMPLGITLEVTLAPPGGASSAGSVSLNTAAADVVTGISTLNASSLPITYRLSVSTGTVVGASGDRTVTFTVVSGT
jgi:hypothetical protein